MEKVTAFGNRGSLSGIGNRSRAEEAEPARRWVLEILEEQPPSIPAAIAAEQRSAMPL